MNKIIKIGEREVALNSNAATPIRYTNLFHENFFSAIEAAMSAERMEAADTVHKLAYVMAMQAEDADFKKLNEDTFISWLEGFESMDMINALESVVNVYLNDAAADVDPK